MIHRLITIAAPLLLAIIAIGPLRADPGGNTRQLVDLPDGASATLYGKTYTAHGAVRAVAVLSSEFVAVAVIEGTLSVEHAAARPGDALVTGVDSGRTEKLRFDAARLKSTLRPEWLTTVAPALDRLAAGQKRARFWGRLVPVGVNAAAPRSPALEAVRQSYLGNDTVAALRREAQGKPELLARLTAARFAAALAARDARAAADLIDPKPFTDTGVDPASWQRARLAFATGLIADAALVAALAGAPTAVANDATAFDAGGYRIHLIPRDRALFVTSVETL